MVERSVTEINRSLVLDFFDLAFRRRDVSGAAQRYLAGDYRQHNPHVPDGAAAFVSAVTAILDLSPETTFELKRVVADGDLVVLHIHLKTAAVAGGSAIVDFFRVEDGLIVEHWDVVQPVPDDAVNANTMF